MLTLASVVAAAAAVGAIVRWLRRRVDRLGRSRPFPAISVLLAALLSLGCAVPVLLHARLERRLAGVASQLTGARVAVHCQTLGQAWTDAHTELGYVPSGPDRRPAHVTVIARDTCSALGDWLRSGRDNPSRDQIVGVHVLTHEAMHMAGNTSEATTECLAVQRDAWTAQALGASHDEAVRLARSYWQQVYPLMPDDYRSAACGPGGALDQHLPDPPWALD